MPDRYFLLGEYNDLKGGWICTFSARKWNEQNEKACDIQVNGRILKCGSWRDGVCISGDKQYQVLFVRIQ